jgi:ankyrin repeat protein
MPRSGDMNAIAGHSGPTQIARQVTKQTLRLFMKSVIPYLCILAATLTIRGADTSGHQIAKTELLRAIERGDRPAWNRMLREGADVTARDADGNTPLHLAALHGHADCVRALLDRGADANATNNAAATPLIYGITDTEIVRALLEHHANPNAMTKLGMTPLLSAVTRGQSYEVAKLLIEAGAEVHGTREGPWDGGALYRAIESGDHRTIDLLFSKGVPIKASGNSFSPLDMAAMSGDLKTVKRLVEAGADVNYSADGYGDSPGHALNWAMWSENHDVAAYLIDHGSDLKFAPSINSQTPPMVWAGFSQAGDPTIAKMLVAKGLEVNTRNGHGESALFYALKTGEDTELTRYLRSVGAKEPEIFKRNKTIPSRAVPPVGPERAAMIRKSVQRAIDLMQHSSEVFLQRREACVSCHNQLHPALAYGMARERGFRVDELALGHQLKVQVENLDGAALEASRQLIFGGFEGAKGILALHALRYEADEAVLSQVRFLRETQTSQGRWFSSFGRAPMEEHSAFQRTAWNIRALKLYPRAGEEAATARCIERAMQWLRRTTPCTITQRANQLLGLHAGGEPREKLEEHIQALLAEQRSDGGWAQLSTRDSDAWATGLALYALYEPGGIPTDHPAYERGVAFLLRTQFDDGSWWIRDRAWPFQQHFDGQFPHGKDQWISIAGTAWATMALLATVEPTSPPEELPTGQQLIAKWSEAQKEAAASKSPDETFIFKGTRTVAFEKDILPILENSCLDCHSGKKPKGSFKITDRESLIKGGQSGMPTFTPGHGEKSQLIRHVADQIEDLEMPPLRKRKTYPALTPEQVQKLMTWINEGAEWPEGVVLE